MNGIIDRVIAMDGTPFVRSASSDREAAKRQDADQRIADSFQIAAAILTREADGIGDVARAQGALRQAAARLSSMARVHRTLSRSPELDTVDMSWFFGTIAIDISESLGLMVDVRVEGVFLPFDVAMNMGLIVSELAIRAAASDVDGDRASTLTVDTDRNGFGDIRLRVYDDGPGPAAGIDLRRSGGPGMSVTVSTVARLGGRLRAMPAMIGLPGAGFEIVLPATVACAA